MFSIPNSITALNLYSGCLGVVAVLEGRPDKAMMYIGLALIFDFADGWVARKLGQSSPLGIQLDSLADVVSFGLLPGCMMYSIFKSYNSDGSWPAQAAWLPLMVTVFAAFRLARFNVETTGEPGEFKGLPVPASGMAMAGLYGHFALDGGSFNFFDVRIFIVLFSIAASAAMVSRTKVLKFQVNKTFFQKHFILVFLYLLCLAVLMMKHHYAFTLLIIAHVLYGIIYFAFSKNKT
ncbi:MAG: CDP-diacylglycerol--serine O-phosphatidyltransferase [Saprospiraceae bacterium]